MPMDSRVGKEASEPGWLQAWRRDTQQNYDVNALLPPGTEWNKNTIAKDFVIKFKEGKVYSY